MPGEIRNYNEEDYRTTSPIHIKAAGQMTIEEYRRELIETGELAKEAVAHEVQLEISED